MTGGHQKELHGISTALGLFTSAVRPYGSHDNDETIPTLPPAPSFVSPIAM
jgi:hypothetical protein